MATSATSRAAGLRVAPCRQLCDWRPARTRTTERLFACAGCGSQWSRSQATGWAPRQADGSWPRGVREELLTSGPPADAADSAGS